METLWLKRVRPGAVLPRRATPGSAGMDVCACIEEKLSAYRERLKAVVLGCTHFVWLRDAVQRAVPGVRIFDGNQGLALHLIDVLQTNCLETAAEYGVCEYHTTSHDPEILRRLEDFARRVEG